MKIDARAFRGLEAASLEFETTILIAGRNYAGKSSLLRAVAAALSSVDIPYLGLDDSGKTKALMPKAQAGALVKAGMDTGTVTVEQDGSSVSVSWPKCERKTTGKAPPQASAFATGLVSVLSMSDKARAKFFTTLLDINPTRDDLAWGKIGDDLDKDALDLIWKFVEEKGWDIAYTEVRERIARLKGQWEAIANTPYGDKKAEGWFPEGWDAAAMGSTSMDSLSATVTTAKQTLERMIAGKAVESSKVTQWQAQANYDEAADKQAEITSKETELKKLEAELAAIPSPTAKEKSVACPHCTKAVVIDGVSLRKPRPAPDLNEQTANTIKADKLRLAINVLKNALQDLRVHQRRHDAAMILKAEAQKQIDALPENDTPEHEVEAAREALRIAELKVNAFTNKSKADQTLESIKRNQVIAEALGPEGVRKTKLVSSLKGFNKLMGELSTAANWPDVYVDTSLDIRYGGRHHALVSESERYRINAVLQMAIAEADKSQAVIFDGADILDTNGRNGLLAMLINGPLQGKKYLIGMTYASKEKTPDIAKITAGISVWIEDGRAAPLAA